MESLINLIPFILGALCLGLGLALYFRSIEAKNLWHMVNELEHEIDSQAKDWKRINSELLAEAKRWKELAKDPKLGADIPSPILLDRNADKKYKREIMDLSKDEHIIAEALLDARKVQEYLWQELSMQNDKEYLPHTWGKVFQKRVNKIMEIDINHPYSIVQLRKRVLQQAALSIVAIKVLDNIKNKSDE